MLPVLHDLFSPFLPSIAWIGLFLFILLRLNIPALKRYGKQMEHANVTRHEGLILIARNQMVRYWARTIEAVLALGLGVLGVLSVAYPKEIVGNYIAAILSLGYFFLTGMITGWLTYRDLKVLDKIEKMGG